MLQRGCENGDIHGVVQCNKVRLMYPFSMAAKSAEPTFAACALMAAVPTLLTLNLGCCGASRDFRVRPELALCRYYSHGSRAEHKGASGACVPPTRRPIAIRYSLIVLG
jgi:hypothetical protein